MHIFFDIKSSHQRVNKKKMDDKEASNEETKMDLFVGLYEAFSNLEEQQARQAIMVPVTTRGIGVATVQLAYAARRCGDDIRLGIPDIRAQYRVYLGLLEAKIVSVKSQFRLIPRFAESIYEHAGITSAMLMMLKNCKVIPIVIEKIIDAVGVICVNTNGCHYRYLPVVAKSVDCDGTLIPRPENVTLTSLRKTVEMLADKDTPLEVRRSFEKNSPIPGAIWTNHLLMNPDEIIPEDYDLQVGLRDDILLIAPFLNTLQKHVPRMVGGPLNSSSIGRMSLFQSNQLEDLRCPNLNPGERLDAYYDRCMVEGNITRYTSPFHLDQVFRIEGLIVLLGERPTDMNLMHPLYTFRHEALHTCLMGTPFKAVCQIIYAM